MYYSNFLMYNMNYINPQPSNVTTYPFQECANTVPLNHVIDDLVSSSKNSTLSHRPIAFLPRGNSHIPNAILFSGTFAGLLALLWFLL